MEAIRQQVLHTQSRGANEKLERRPRANVEYLNDRGPGGSRVGESVPACGDEQQRRDREDMVLPWRGGAEEMLEDRNEK